MEAQGSRRLVVVRHAKSDYPVGVADHDRPLNDRGNRDAPFIGSWLTRNVPLAPGERPLVLVSSALRAQLTWQRATNGLSGGWTAFDAHTEPRIYEAGLTTLLQLVGGIPDDITTAVVVGHNPTACDIVAMLAQESALKQQAIVKFPTSSVAVLRTDEPWAQAVTQPGSWQLLGFTVPRA